MITKIFASILLVGLITDATANSWGYAGHPVDPYTWYQYFPLCGGKKQSPIDIITGAMIHIPYSTPLQFTGSPVGGCTLTNTGQIIRCTLDPSFSYTVTGGPLGYNYRLAQVDVHFGSNPTQGSEHRVNGNAYAAEVQFVFYNSDMFGSLSEATNKPNGIAIIGAFVSFVTDVHMEFDKIASNAYLVPYAGNTVHIPSFDISQLMPLSNYYVTYAGSLTTPSCDESVTWIVLDNHIHVTDTQINNLRNTLFTGDSPINPGIQMADNFRPVQPLNARRVFFN